MHVRVSVRVCMRTPPVLWSEGKGISGITLLCVLGGWCAGANGQRRSMNRSQGRAVQDRSLPADRQADSPALWFYHSDF